MSSPDKEEVKTKVRIDKWLWMVRLYKTRTMAGDACSSGKVKIDDVNCKPSREIKIGSIVQVRTGQIQKTIQILNSPKSRIAAKSVPDYYLDLTDKEEYDKLKQLDSQFEHREHGIGRPTKKDRRQLNKLKIENCLNR
ncbi:MAG: RNA-binding S4 domain-containing protein [Bacteroidales bacterium]|jgi:ribosome-associated heat shock protein Hsp15|nr:RNA-binding S4 domain-containing protein [Bacteroidales bacterium]